MKCKQCEDILLNYNLEDIPENIKMQIDLHRNTCIRCAQLWEDNLLINRAMEELPVVELDEDRVSLVHSKIMDRIHQEIYRQSAHATRFQVPARLWRTAATAAAALVIGVVLGNFVPGKPRPATPDLPIASVNFDELLKDNTLNDIRIREVNQTTGELVISASRTNDLTLTGNITDPEIQKVLAYALVRDQNPGTRLRSVKLMEGVTTSNAVQQALITSVLQDENQGVRQRALRALSQYPINDNLRSTYLNIISNDPSPALRIEAIQILMKDEDATTRSAVLDASEEETNEMIQDILKRYYQEPGQPLEMQ